MDEDRIKSKAEDLAGKIKEKAGKAAADATSETQRVTDKAKGKARDLLGKLKDASREAAEKVREKSEAQPSPDEDKTGQDEEEVA
jgi:uncharacterized protein YjbJ (UPF0337 family)